jgi:hypothetical protein
MTAKVILIIIAALLFFFAVDAVCNSKETTDKPHIVKEKWYHPPKQVKNVKRFTPWHNPTNKQMRMINRWETNRWNSPSLLGLAWCESGYRAKVSAGVYGGYFQYNLSYWPGIWDKIPKDVKVVHKRVVKKPIVRFRKWSHIDGWIRREMSDVNQKRYLVLKGKLPKNADPMHGWAAWRATAYIWGGHYPGTVTWECGL